MLLKQFWWQRLHTTYIDSLLDYGGCGMEENQSKTRAQDKWDAKAGMVAKTYKVKKTSAERFAAACKDRGVSMGIKLGELMEMFADGLI